MSEGDDLAGPCGHSEALGVGSELPEGRCRAVRRGFQELLQLLC